MPDFAREIGLFEHIYQHVVGKYTQYCPVKDKYNESASLVFKLDVIVLKKCYEIKKSIHFARGILQHSFYVAGGNLACTLPYV